MPKLILALAAVAALSGCASTSDTAQRFKGQFENRLVCTQAGDKAMVVSIWFEWVGIATLIADRDRPDNCRPRGGV